MDLMMVGSYRVYLELVKLFVGSRCHSLALMPGIMFTSDLIKDQKYAEVEVGVGTVPYA